MPKKSVVKEKDFQRTVIHLAELTGWLFHYVPDSRMCPPGYPDLFLVRGKRMLFRELKTGTGKLRPKQEQFINAIKEAGGDVKVWRPCDWEEIKDTLENG